MPGLVLLADQKTFMGVTGTTDDALLTTLLTHAEVLLETACDRVACPFQAGGTSRIETHDGTGSGKVFTDYPIATLTSLLIGGDPTNPDETLAVTDPTVIRFGVGTNRIDRVDGEMLGEYGDPRVVQITYTPQDDLPEDAKLAVKRVVALIYGQRGSEDVVSEGDSGYAHALAKYAADLPDWQAAVLAHKRNSFR